MANHQKPNNVRQVCYPSGNAALRRVLGIALIVLGVLIILFCVPYWAWWALLGAALIVLGLTLARSA